MAKSKIMEKDAKQLEFIVSAKEDVGQLKKLSTEKLIIWIVGRSNELNVKLSPEDIVIECWLINPEKHSMRKFNYFPDTHVVMKRIGEMKGKKGLLIGSETIGYKLTNISKVIYRDTIELITQKLIQPVKGKKIANRNISSIEETPYNRLKRTSAYLKYSEGRINEIVESDYLYFYGFNWHSRRSFIQNRIKNVDDTIKRFSSSDSILDNLFKYLNQNFSRIKEQLINK